MADNRSLLTGILTGMNQGYTSQKGSDSFANSLVKMMIETKMKQDLQKSMLSEIPGARPKSISSTGELTYDIPTEADTRSPKLANVLSYTRSAISKGANPARISDMIKPGRFSTEGEQKQIESSMKSGLAMRPKTTKEKQRQLTAETAGKLAMVGQGEQDLNEAESILFPNGKFDGGMAFQTNFPGGGMPWSEGRTAFSKVLNAVNAKLRVETGAQANPSEVKNILQRFMPTTRDSDSTAKDKFRRLREFMSNTKSIIDPTGKYQYKTKGKTTTAGDIFTGGINNDLVSRYMQKYPDKTREQIIGAIRARGM